MSSSRLRADADMLRQNAQNIRKQAEDLIQAIDYFFVINGDIFCPQFSFEKVF